MPEVRVEFHCHSSYSKDSLVQPARLVAAARQAGLDRLIVTDHNSIGGALATQKLAPELVIVGEEIMTTRGELLASFVKEGLPHGLEPIEAIRRLRAQGAFISVSHPFDWLRGGHWELPDLLEIAPLVDAIETFNARCMNMQPNQLAADFAREHGLPGTVGSDAHTMREVGRATLILDDFNNAEELKKVIPGARQETMLSSPWIHLASRYASTLKQLGIVRRPGV